MTNNRYLKNINSRPRGSLDTAQKIVLEKLGAKHLIKPTFWPWICLHQHLFLNHIFHCCLLPTLSHFSPPSTPPPPPLLLLKPSTDSYNIYDCLVHGLSAENWRAYILTLTPVILLSNSLSAVGPRSSFFTHAALHQLNCQKKKRSLKKGTIQKGSTFGLVVYQKQTYWKKTNLLQKSLLSHWIIINIINCQWGRVCGWNCKSSDPKWRLISVHSIWTVQYSLDVECLGETISIKHTRLNLNLQRTFGT